MFSRQTSDETESSSFLSKRKHVILSDAKDRRVLLLLLLAVGVRLGTPMLHAQAADPILRKVDDHYNRLSSLRAAYTEHYTGMGMDRTETGTLLLKKPGRMRWNYTTPAGKVFLLDGKYGWFYTPGDNQATRIAAKKLDDLRSPLRFLLGHSQLQKELDQVTVTPEGSAFRISGVPKGMAQRVKLLSLTVDASGSIQKMRIEEIDGSITEFSYSAMQENVPVRDSDFTFTPPAGVAIVDGIAPI
jgi:outer membrane lipoprotein carrier protein